MLRADFCIYFEDKRHFLKELANFYLRFIFEQGWKFLPIMQIYNDNPGNATCRFICNANTPLDHANAVQQSDSEEGANCAEVAGSTMRACNWRTRSVCVKTHLHFTSTVFVRRWSFINWNASASTVSPLWLFPFGRNACFSVHIIPLKSLISCGLSTCAYQG